MRGKSVGSMSSRSHGLLGAHHDGGDRGGEAYPCDSVVLSAGALQEDLPQSAVRGEVLRGDQEELDESVPGVFMGEGRLGPCGDALHRVLEDGFDEFLAVGEAAVGGAHADARVTGDVVERDLEPSLGEDLLGCGDEAPPVAFRVGPQGTGRGRLRGWGGGGGAAHGPTVPIIWRILLRFGATVDQ